MSIPDFQSIMRPMLDLAADGKEHPLSAAREELAEIFKLTEEDKATLLPSGRTPRFANRVAWAKVYLSQAGALDTPGRGVFQITDRGRELLKSAPKRIAIKDLQRFPEFVEFRAPKQHKEEATTPTAVEPKVVLIDGRQLAGLMIDFNVGVTPVASYETKRIESDYFSEE